LLSGVQTSRTIYLVSRCLENRVAINRGQDVGRGFDDGVVAIPRAADAPRPVSCPNPGGPLDVVVETRELDLELLEEPKPVCIQGFTVPRMTTLGVGRR
jgi:hypothetical protein